MVRAATAQGTADYRQQMVALGIMAEHYRESRDLWFATIGLGSYLGNADDATDRQYYLAVQQALRSGCNVIDTASNYRFQRSERAIGEALANLFAQGEFQREAVIVSTKGGFLPFDGQQPVDLREYVMETFIKPGVFTPDELVAGCHCLSPRFIEHQLAQSLKNLRLDTVDIYYLHNPETQLMELPRPKFYQRLRMAFETLEKAVTDGKIKYYGTATWNGYRLQPTATDYLGLEKIVEIATEVAGYDHHFRVIQLPYNLGMPEAMGVANQQYKEGVGSVLTVAAALGLTVEVSASILQARLTAKLPDRVRDCFPGLDTDAQRAIQFVRSTPGVTTALVGMGRVAHVRENLATATVAPLSPKEFEYLFDKEV
jgi:aryl-alcohol dehydrogenase-like predicted oxidoreductase